MVEFELFELWCVDVMAGHIFLTSSNFKVYIYLFQSCKIINFKLVHDRSIWKKLKMYIGMFSTLHPCKISWLYFHIWATKEKKKENHVFLAREPFTVKVREFLCSSLTNVFHPEIFTNMHILDIMTSYIMEQRE